MKKRLVGLGSLESGRPLSADSQDRWPRTPVRGMLSGVYMSVTHFAADFAELSHGLSSNCACEASDQPLSNDFKSSSVPVRIGRTVFITPVIEIVFVT